MTPVQQKRRNKNRAAKRERNRMPAIKRDCGGPTHFGCRCTLDLTIDGPYGNRVFKDDLTPVDTDALKISIMYRRARAWNPPLPIVYGLRKEDRLMGEGDKADQLREFLFPISTGLDDLDTEYGFRLDREIAEAQAKLERLLDKKGVNQIAACAAVILDTPKRRLRFDV